MTAPAPTGDLLMTVDVEIADDRDLAAQEAAIGRIARDLAGIPVSWFCTATAAEAFSRPLRALAKDGHAIGCHGLDHSPGEDYRKLPRKEAKALLREATDRIERAVGTRPRLFRGPRMTTSAATQDVLEELGYHADFSPCARRLDPLAASAYQPAWLSVANRPYRPRRGDPFRDGDGRLLAVPLSGLGIPFLSGALYCLGQGATRQLARALAGRGGPLTYLFHSYEFVAVERRRAERRPWHQRLYPADPERRYAMNRALIAWLVGELGLRPVAGDAFVRDWADEVRVPARPQPTGAGA